MTARGKPGRPWLEPAVVQATVAAYRAGEPIVAIGQRVGVVERRVYQILGAAGITFNRRNGRPQVGDDLRARILAQYQQGLTYRAIMQATGVSKGAITHIVRMSDTPLRRPYLPRGKDWDGRHRTIAAMRAAPAPAQRRCSACLAISTATHCPACGTELYVPDKPLERARPGRADWTGAERECVACGDAFRSFHAKHVYCLACGQARTDALDQARYRRTKGHSS